MGKNSAPGNVVRLLALLCVFAGIAATSTLPNFAGTTAKVMVPAFKDLAGKSYAPSKSPTVYVFLATDCPVASRLTPSVARLAKQYATRGVRVFAVYSNESETPVEIRRHATERGLTKSLPVVQDASGTIARALHATMTPQAILVGANGTVQYSGTVEKLPVALNSLLAGKAVHIASQVSLGCALRLRDRPPLPIGEGGGGGRSNITYTQVAPLLDKHCVSCHRAGEVGPMPLDTYKQAASWAKAIASFSKNRQMPPWKADSHGEFLNERRLTDAEIETLEQWAKAGAPAGTQTEQTFTPAKYPAPGTWTLGEPDVIFSKPEGYTIPAEGKDVYRCFVIPSHIATDKWVKSIEFQPGNRRIVHHVNVFVDMSGVARKLDAADPAPGYTSPTPGNVPGFVAAGTLGGWVPGHIPWNLPEGVGNFLPKGADIVLEVHYVTTGKPETDNTRFGLRFLTSPPKKRLHLGEVTVRRIRIPAGEDKYEINTSEFVHDDITLLSITPHMHLLGRSMKAVVEFPDGTSLTLVSVPDWDFSWQMSYRFKQPLRLPQNSRIDLTAVYNNSTSNMKNPNSPPKDVHEGEGTKDEMCNLFVAYTIDGEPAPQN